MLGQAMPQPLSVSMLKMDRYLVAVFLLMGGLTKQMSMVGMPTAVQLMKATRFRQVAR